ncbi:MAG: LpqB family beta-propeller domain-containing protein [Bifidobacteriaceae bacterium]|nr:LpqB family beta-propeller domain-containing protein [Bifidobacteriaceae bacterium]MCI1979519.1 LpqB family beta-propeller domain-containing protein [Bifidobacteriaceae bacterium]
MRWLKQNRHRTLDSARVRRAVESAVIAVSLFFCSACSASIGLPVSSAVTQLPVQQKQQKHVYTSPRGPKSGADPEDILVGFLAALPAGPQNDGFTVAKKFLTTSASRNWDPDQNVLVFSSEPSFWRQAKVMEGVEESKTDKVSMTASFKISGTVDNHGLYSAANRSLSKRLGYTFKKTEGQWRIDSLPQGIQIQDSVFDQTFRQVCLYQVDSTLRTLIPDIRWFGWRQWRTSAVKEILSEPAGYLGKAAVRVATPEIMQTTESVPVVDNMVQVRLSSSVMKLSKKQRALLVHQIRMTLGEGDSSYELSIRDEDGNDISADDSDLNLEVVVPRKSLYALNQDVIFKLRYDSLTRMAQIRKEDATDVRGLVFSSAGGALQRSDSTVRCINAKGKDCGSLFDGQSVDFIASGYGRETWASTRTPHAQLLVQNSEGLQEIPLTWIGEKDQVVALAVSPEGSRLLVAVREEGKTVLRMAGVERDVHGAVVSVSNASTIIAQASGISSACFHDSLTVVYAIFNGQQGARQVAPGPEYDQNVPEDTTMLAAGFIDDVQGTASLDTNGVVRSVTGPLSTPWLLLDAQVSAIASGE